MYSLIDNQAELQKPEDSKLIERALNGHQAAFEQLIRRYQSRLYFDALRLTRVPEFAEDLVQDTLIQAYCKLHTFRHESAFYSWLYRISLNQFLAQRRRRQVPLYFLEELENSYGEELIDPSEAVERRAMRSEDRHSVREALKRLDNQSRHILELREMDGKSYAQISRQLNIKLGTVRSRLSRAKDKLQRVLQGEFSLGYL